MRENGVSLSKQAQTLSPLGPQFCLDFCPLLYTGSEEEWQRAQSSSIRDIPNAWYHFTSPPVLSLSLSNSGSELKKKKSLLRVLFISWSSSEPGISVSAITFLTTKMDVFWSDWKEQGIKESTWVGMPYTPSLTLCLLVSFWLYLVKFIYFLHFLNPTKWKDSWWCLP